ncbi:hypothetical protein WG66_012346 [Moniliophthora roreri]|nr:hypothetical protein WG66_012346 [Moniliophthora roreri]
MSASPGPFSPQSLPLLAESGLQDASRAFQSAYELVVEAEATASTAEERMNARVVGFFITEFWRSRIHFGDTPVARIAQELNCPDAQIESQDQHAVVYMLGIRYRENLLCAFQRSKGPTYMPSSRSSPPYNSIQQFITQNLQSSPKDYRTAKKYALARDGFKCMLSHKFDATSVETISAVEKMMREEGRGFEATNCCHVFSESTAQDIDSTDPAQVKRQEHAATALATLKSFGLNTLVDKILQRGVHDPTNLLTMSISWHAQFNSLELWLEGTSTANEACFLDLAHNLLNLTLYSMIFAWLWRPGGTDTQNILVGCFSYRDLLQLATRHVLCLSRIRRFLLFMQLAHA